MTRQGFGARTGTAHVLAGHTVCGTTPENAIPLPALRRRERPVPVPASFAQERLWFIEQSERGRTTGFNVPSALRIRGALDVPAFARALQGMVDRHEVLRTRFEEVDGEPVQIVETDLRLTITHDDVRGCGEEQLRDIVHETLRRDMYEPFALERLPLIRVRLLRVAEDDRVLLRTIHHIIWDGWSEGVFVRELFTLYATFRVSVPSQVPPVALQYADYALWQREHVAANLEAARAYWARELTGAPEVLRLPADRPRLAGRTFDGAESLAEIPASFVSLLKEVGRSAGASLYMTLLAAFAALLARYSGSGDVIVGSGIAGRNDTLLRDMIGCVVNMIPLRLHVDGRAPFRSLLRSTRDSMLGAYRHQDTPFQHIMQMVGGGRSINTPPLVQVVFDLQPRRALIQPEDLMVEAMTDLPMQVRFDLEVHAREQDGALRLAWGYNRELFEPWRIEQMARHYSRLLAAVVRDMDTAVAELDLLDDDEQRKLLDY